MNILTSMNDRLQNEIDGYRRYGDLLKEAMAVQELMRSAGLPIPPSLERLLGDSETNSARRFIVPPLDGPPRPKEAGQDWIWLPAAEASPQTLARAILRRQGDFVAPKAIADEVGKINKGVNARSVYNCGPRLIESGELEKSQSDGKWKLTDSAKAPIIDGEYVWGSIQTLDKSEIASHRREVILHILRASADGLQIMQITRQLKDSGLCKSPQNKDLVKMDMENLKRNSKVRRVSGRKWMIVRKND